MQIEFQGVSYAYGAGTPFETLSLHDVNLTIPDQSFTAFIGHTGSGKSTAIKHLNGLLKPTQGTVQIGPDQVTKNSKGEVLRRIRSQVGIVFQFPESQLFEETVLKDVMFGPLNYGASEEEARQKAIEALDLVGLPSELYDQSPFDLSGGQMRRVAIAGILAMEPQVLVLDEPTAGLDPKGHRDMMAMFYRLYKERQLTVVLVTHQMNDAAQYANHIVVMNRGTVVRQGPTEEIFSDADWLRDHSLSLPDSLEFKAVLADKAGIQLQDNPLTVDQLADSILNYFELGEVQDEE
ncbi:MULTISPECIES: energy-coupling factor ABC transporter ATP-binding protein [Aerococcus]|uniref:energy-coupling factor ABC transporter ATP-binding protein n=1 Tax=Aerococcus TaxID=1375 RepID=UPI0018A7CE3A|nr:MULTISPECIES: energy-coupling factor ABC transporter ATP-binding protein [Aerococcus]MCY3036838.1 energy-coupling factor ABC transporter ATP-binding protein [Aerococcus sp. Group 2]MCY3040089.1 energy-coupling factor ABC transporter ATP-binding protein [Aerococcus sp. Group 2]MCY3041638.1 energy-coupling factor ABC transporter ATP-binding protein [Aerococcus sp. Group 2]MCY3043482.1 energy-coupling factor ABC transporter ATP-binding protein [Aerococcus sp. Group 2]MDK6521290.1 energy-coupli